MIRTIIATQAREGIITTREQAEAAYEKVTNMSRYNRPQTEQEKLDMAKKKAATTAESKERAAVGRERRLALALRAILDVTDKVETGGNKPLDAAVEEAQQLLVELGYTGLEGIPRTLERLNAELQSAFAAGDGETISRLGRELAKTKAGKVYHRKVADEPAT